MIDIVGSTVIGIYFVYMIMNFNIKMNDAINTSALNNVALWDSIEFGDLLDHDFNKIGYRTDSVFVFSKAEPTAIEFYGDLDNNGIVDTVQYILMDSTYLLNNDYNFNNKSNPAHGTENPDDILLYRIVNGTINSTDNAITLVTEFQITYNDVNCNKITTPLSTHAERKNIKGITLNYTIASATPVKTEDDEFYEIVVWEKTFSPKNIY